MNLVRNGDRHGGGSADRHPAELYNIEFDPGERINLAANGKYAQVDDQMRKMRDEELAPVGLTPGKDRMRIDEGITKELPNAEIR